MRNIFLLFAIVSLSGCYTQKKAGNQMVKAHVEYPVLTSFYCNQWYPIRWYDSTVIKYIKGDTEYIPSDPIYVNCDSVVKAALNDKTIDPTKTKVQPPPNTKQVDTVSKVSDKQGESTAALQAEKYKVKQCVEEMQKVVNAATEEAAKLKTWLLITGVLAAYTAARWVLRIWGIKLP